MTNEAFEAKYPLLLEWITTTVNRHASQSSTVASLGFNRLPHYFDSDLLALAKVVYVPMVPKPPLRALGLHQFSEFEQMEVAGITYLDTFFSSDAMRGCEGHHFHELVHVVQWQVLGPRLFLAAYADGLERFGYRQSPLEEMAYDLENAFQTSRVPFDVAKIVGEKLRPL
jgi:hypothetical protein